MKFLKNNLKVIIGFLVGVILAGGIVYAATSASEVTYTTNKNGEVQTVADALNDLYSKTQTLNYLTGKMAEDNSDLSLNYVSDFEGKVLVVITHVTDGSTNNSNVKLNNAEIDLTEIAHTDNYRKFEYAIIDVSIGDVITCFTNSRTYNNGGQYFVWSYSSCSLYGLR